MKIIKTTQLFVKTADKPGEFAKILAVLGKAKINTLACAGYSRNREGRVMLVTENNARAAVLIKKAGYALRKDPVVVVTGKDKAGAGAKIAAKLAKAKINLSGVYAAGAGKKYLVVFQAADAGKLAAALK